MFDRIRQHVDSYLAARGESGMNPHKVIWLDHSEGQVEGALQLIFAEDSAHPVLIAKGAPIDRVRRRAGRSIYEVEYDNLTTLARIGMNAGAPTTPEPLGLWLEDGLVVTLQAALPGELLKNIPGPELFSEAAIGSTLDDIMRWWQRLQTAFGVRRETLDEASYERRIIGQLDAFGRRFEIAPDERSFLDRRLRDRRLLLGQDLPLFARHGDLCTANMARLPDGIGVFDWEFPLVHELPLFDVFHLFASLRYPYRGRRGESSHFDSFTAIYWDDNYANRELRRRLAVLCDTYSIPREALGDLFLVALIQIANLKYEGYVEIHGPGRAADPAGELPWRNLGGRDKNAPFACICDGAFENTRHCARHGLPDFGLE